MFEAVILAGGVGTRLREVTDGLPKPMVDVAGEPFLFRIMKQLEAGGCTHVVLSLGYRANYVIQAVLSHRPVSCEVTFVVEDTPLGTGGAIKKAASFIKGERFLALNGDSFSDINFGDFFDASKSVGLLISGVFVDDASRYGTLLLGDKNRVLGFKEKGRKGRGVISSGIYALKKDEILAIQREEFSFENDFVSNYEGVFSAFISNSYFIDIGIPSDYRKACEYFNDK